MFLVEIIIKNMLNEYYEEPYMVCGDWWSQKGHWFPVHSCPVRILCPAQYRPAHKNQKMGHNFRSLADTAKWMVPTDSTGKIHLPGLSKIIPLGSNLSPKSVFSGRHDSGPKCIFGHYSSYIQDRRDFKPSRVVYFFARNTMVAFMLLYLENWGC